MTMTDDRDTIRKQDVEGIVRDICMSYSSLRVRYQGLSRLIQGVVLSGDFNQVVLQMMHVYGVPRFMLKHVGYNARNIGDSLAVLAIKSNTVTGQAVSFKLAFKESKKGLMQIPVYTILHAVAHELAHARMHMDHHRYMNSEFATDVLAYLVIGQSDEYRRIVFSSKERLGYVRPDLFDLLNMSMRRYGEVIYL